MNTTTAAGPQNTALNGHLPWPWLLPAIGLLSACGGGQEAAPASPPPLLAAALPARMTAAAPLATAAAMPTTPASPATRRGPRIQVRDGILHLDIEHQPLPEILAAIASQAGMRIVLAPGIGSPSVSAVVNGMPLADGLRQLLRGRDLLFAFDAISPAPATPAAVWVYPAGQGPRSHPDDKEPAISADAQARGLVNADPALRRRTLLRSLDPGRALPEQTLWQLARADADQEVRKLALSALMPDPSTLSGPARAALQAALHDSDAQVQLHAKTLLEQADLAQAPP